MFLVQVIWQHAKFLSVDSKAMAQFDGYVRILFYGIMLKISGPLAKSNESLNLLHWNGI